MGGHMATSRRAGLQRCALILLLCLTAVAVVCAAGCGQQSLSPSSSPSPQLTNDTTAPVTTASYDQGWNNKLVVVKLEGSDDSGVCTTKYCVDSQSVHTGTRVVVHGDGKHTLAFWSSDEAGNVEPQQTARILIDTQGPKTDVLNSPTITQGARLSVTFVIRDHTPEATATMKVSGPQSCSYALGKLSTNKPHKYHISTKLAAGTYHVWVKATDLAGNALAAAGTSTITVNPKPATVWVYITNTGECFHRWGCWCLRKSHIRISREEAVAEGYRPCSFCNP